MMQTLAIFFDAYRELNSKRLFWITLMLSGLVVAAFALVGINENGLRIIVWDLDLPGLNSNVIKPETFYKLMFTNLGIGFWLAWIATILALVTTAGIIPDFVSAGSIDLVLCKPLGRLRLFLTKYVTGLLFVALQVSVFSVASFFVLGIKGGTWEPAVFLAVPVITIFFSYLYCICALLGLVTRSTIASLMLTMLAWFFMFAVGSAENLMLLGQKAIEQEVKDLDRSIQRRELAIERLRQRGTEIDFATASAPLQQLLDRDRIDRDDSLRGKANLDFAHRIAMGVKTALPKTSETIGLLERWMVDLAELPAAPENALDMNMEVDADVNAATSAAATRPGGRPARRSNDHMEQVQRTTEEALRSRSVWWVVGTSLIFEAFVLAIAAWIFCRRDF